MPYMTCSGPDSRSAAWRKRPSSQPRNAPAYERPDGNVVGLREDRVRAGADLVGAVEQPEHPAFDLVADLTHLLERLLGGIVDVPVCDAADHVRQVSWQLRVIALS